MQLKENLTWEFEATSSGALTPEMRKAFEANGVLIVKDFVPFHACDALQKRMSEILVDFKAQDKITSIFSTKTNNHAKERYFLDSAGDIGFFFEEEAFDENGKLAADLELSLNKVSHAIHDKDPVFEEFSYHPRIKSLLLSLGYQKPQLVQSMYIFKQPRIGGVVGYHQDATYLYTEPMPPIGLWFALEDATTENGCLWGLPGQHNEPLRVRFKREGEELQHQVIDATPWDEAKAVPLPAPKGSLVVLHGYFPHGSYPNRSALSRHAYTLHAIDASSRYPSDNWLQRSKEFPFRLM